MEDINLRQSRNNQTPLWKLGLEFALVGALSFGGSVIANIRDLAVNQEQWLADEEFLIVMAISRAMPGLNAVNLAILIADKVRGGLGSVVAVLALLLPGALCVLLIGFVYGLNADHPLANYALGGIAAATVALMGFVTWKLSQATLGNLQSKLIALLTFVLMAVIKIPLGLVILCVLPIAVWLNKPPRF